ncbi:MAG TPA: fibronectin type III domain-containing protein [Opitutaceae bacterium]|jgi:chitodextrinase|nr:fibronectin type III domain-containing protein [Opitutaceae bacterium]
MKNHFSPLVARHRGFSALRLICLLGFAAGLALSAAGQATLPYITDFDSSLGFTTGSLNGQQNWLVLGGSADVTNTVSFLGNQSVVLEPGTTTPEIGIPFAPPSPAQPIVYVDCILKPVASSSISSFIYLDTSLAVLVRNDGVGGGQIFTLDGSLGWVPTPAIFAINNGNNTASDWMRLTFRLDFTAKTWDLYYNGAFAAHDVAFLDDSLTSLPFFIFQGDPGAPSYLNLLYAGPTNLLFPDVNNDGIPDDWETAHGLSLSINQRDLDPDGDGLTNLQEYIYGTDPNNPDTDGDGLSDGQEIALGRNPLVPDPDAFLYGFGGLRVYLRSDAGVSADGTGLVSTWHDLSGHSPANDAFQTDASQQPQLVAGAFNGHPLLHFNGSSDALRLPDAMNSATAGEIFIVTRVTGFNGAANGLCHFGTGDATAYGEGIVWDDFGTASVGSYHGPDSSLVTQCHIYNSSLAADGTSILRFNGREWRHLTGQTISFRSDPLLGSDWFNEWYNGDIAEVIAYDHPLTDAQRDSVYQYLTGKYAPPTISIPGQPSLHVCAIGTTTADLSWSADSAASQHTVATIERQTGTGDFTLIAQVRDADSYTDAGLSAGQAYAYRVKLTSYAGTSAYSDPVTVTALGTDLPGTGLRLWLRATAGVNTDGDGFVSTWADQSGLGHDAFQTDLSALPQAVANAANGLPVLRFNYASNDALQLPNVMQDPENPQSQAGAGEIFIVTRLADFTNPGPNGLCQFGNGYATAYAYNTVWDDFGTENQDSYSGPDSTVLTQSHIYDSSVSADGTSILRFNGVVSRSLTGQTVFFRPDPLLGSDWFGEHYNGDIAEVIVYDHVLTDAERSVVNTYLAGKYAVADTTPPTAPTDLAASDITQNSLTLNWTASTDNIGVVAYDVYKNGTLAGSSATPSLDVTGLTPNTAYSLTVKARDAAGNASDASAPLSVTTLADTSPPTAPTGLAASNVTMTSLTLTWTASTDDVGVTVYDIYSNGVPAGSSALTSFNLVGLSPNTTYSLTVKARDAAGNVSDASAPLSVTTLADTQAPSVPTGLAASNLGPTSFTLGWTVSTDNVGVAGYDIYNNGVLVGSSTTNTFNVTGLTVSTTYALTVQARDAAGNISAASAPLAVIPVLDTQAPTVPAALVASRILADSFQLTWTASTDNVWLSGYDIYQNGTLVGSTVTNAFSVTGLAPSTSYTFTVVARDTSGNVSAASDALAVTTLADYYGGNAPVVAIISGDAQSGPADAFLPQPVVIKVTDAAGVPLANAPIVADIVGGTGVLSADQGGSNPVSTLVLQTDDQGLAHLYLKTSAGSASTTDVVRVQTNPAYGSPQYLTANPPQPLTYVTVPLQPPDGVNVNQLVPQKITPNGHVLLKVSFFNFSLNPNVNPVPLTIGYRWYGGQFQSINRSPAWQSQGVHDLGDPEDGDFYAFDAGAISLADINDAGDVTGWVGTDFGAVNGGYDWFDQPAIWPNGNSAASELATGLPSASILKKDTEINNIYSVHSKNIPAFIADNGEIFGSYLQGAVFINDIHQTPITPGHIGLMTWPSAAGTPTFYDDTDGGPTSMQPETLLGVSPDGTMRLSSRRTSSTTLICSLNDTPLNRTADGPINNSGRFLSGTSWSEASLPLQSIPTLAGGAALAINGGQDILGRKSDGTYALWVWQPLSSAVAAQGIYLPVTTSFSLPSGTQINSLVPSMSDSRMLLGTLLGAGNAKMPVVLVPSPLLAVDANRDGQIKFSSDDASDQTSSDKPFRFWINDGRDGFSTVSGETDVQDALDPSAGPSNSQQNQITCTRDLENFTRLWLSIRGLNQAISSGQITVGLEWHSNTGDAQNGWGSSDGAPAINVYLAAPNHSDITQDGTLDYLTDAATAADQLSPYGFALGTVAKGQPFYFPADAFTTLSDTNPLAYFLFEGVARGKGCLVVTFNSGSPGNYTKICEGGSVYLDLKNIKELYERWTVGDGNGGAPATTAGISPDRLPAGGVQGLQYSSGDPGLAVPSDPNGNKYILFVHGWNLAPWEKDAFAETAFKRLYWQGYKGKFGTFQWPCTYGIDNELDAILNSANFDLGEWSAWRAAAPLRQLFQRLHGAYGDQLYLLAHSMGNVVAGEALRLAAQDGAGQLVNTYIASQAAVTDHCYDSSQPDNLDADLPTEILRPFLGAYPGTSNVYGDWLTSNSSTVIGVRINFYNVNDYALWHDVWELDQYLKPDQGAGQAYYYTFSGDVSTPNLNGFGKYSLGDPAGGSSLSLGTIANAPSSDRYEIMSMAGQARRRALGATIGLGGLEQFINLQSIWPPDSGTKGSSGLDYSARQWHSAEFLFTNVDQKGYWKTLLGPTGFDIIPTP